MVGVTKRPLWKRSLNAGPVAATIAGLALGSVVGAAVAFPHFDRESYALWLFFASTGGSWGYICWLKSDRARDERFSQAALLVAILAIAVLSLAFPNLWWEIRRAGGLVIICIFGGICAASMQTVGIVWGFVHAVSSVQRRYTKAAMASSSDGVWDRDLDHVIPSAKFEA